MHLGAARDESYRQLVVRIVYHLSLRTADASARCSLCKYGKSESDGSQKHPHGDFDQGGTMKMREMWMRQQAEQKDTYIHTYIYYGWHPGGTRHELHELHELGCTCFARTQFSIVASLPDGRFLLTEI